MRRVRLVAREDRKPLNSAKETLIVPSRSVLVPKRLSTDRELPNPFEKYLSASQSIFILFFSHLVLHGIHQPFPSLHSISVLCEDPNRQDG